MTTHTFLLLFQLGISTAEAAPAHNGAAMPSHQSSKNRELNPEEATRFARLALARCLTWAVPPLPPGSWCAWHV